VAVDVGLVDLVILVMAAVALVREGRTVEVGTAAGSSSGSGIAVWVTAAAEDEGEDGAEVEEDEGVIV